MITLPPTMRKAMLNASRLTPAEIDSATKPALISLQALQEGRATENHACVIHTAIAVAEEIERQGVVRGLKDVWSRADAAMQDIYARALQTGSWQLAAADAAHGELHAIKEAMRLHRFQLEQLSAQELARAVNKLIARQQSQGKPVEKTVLEAL